MLTAPPVILVHGFWHGSWCWSLLAEELAVRGIASVAVDLDGHGLKSRSPRARWARPFDPDRFAAEPSAAGEVTASSAAQTLVAQIRRIGGDRPCLVVAHSMGGTVATAAAELAPELFGELVYVSAFAPVTGLPVVGYIVSPENAGELVSGQLAGDPAAIGALRLDPGDDNGHDLLRQTFYNDVDPVTAAAATALLGPDGPAGIVTESLTVTAGRYGSIPHTYIVCLRDKAIPAPLQRRFVTEIDAISATPTTVIEFDSAHSPFLSRPAGLADVLQSAHAGAAAAKVS